MRREHSAPPHGHERWHPGTVVAATQVYMDRVRGLGRSAAVHKALGVVHVCNPWSGFGPSKSPPSPPHTPRHTTRFRAHRPLRAQPWYQVDPRRGSNAPSNALPTPRQLTFAPEALKTPPTQTLLATGAAYYSVQTLDVRGSPCMWKDTAPTRFDARGTPIYLEALPQSKPRDKRAKSLQFCEANKALQSTP